jgi:hypothetical protein
MSCAGHIYPKNVTAMPPESSSEGQQIAGIKDLTTYTYFSTLQTTPLPSGQTPKRYFKSYQDYIASLKGRTPR